MKWNCWVATASHTWVFLFDYFSSFAMMVLQGGHRVLITATFTAFNSSFVLFLRRHRYQFSSLIVGLTDYFFSCYSQARSRRLHCTYALCVLTKCYIHYGTINNVTSLIRQTHGTIVHSQRGFLPNARGCMLHQQRHKNTTLCKHPRNLIISVLGTDF